MTIDKFAETPEERRACLEDMRAICTKSWPSHPSMVIGTAEYVILHYNLLKERPKGVADSGETIRTKAKALGGFHIDGSVWVLQQPSMITAEAIDWAAFVWNAVVECTAGLLIEGDAIYVHYSGLRRDKVSFTAQVVPPGAKSLSLVEVIDPKASNT